MVTPRKVSEVVGSSIFSDARGTPRKEHSWMKVSKSCWHSMNVVAQLEGNHQDNVAMMRPHAE